MCCAILLPHKNVKACVRCRMLLCLTKLGDDGVWSLSNTSNFSPLCITNTSTLTLINTSKHFIHFKYGNFQFSSFKNPTCSLKNEIGMQQIFRTNAQILIYFENHDETVLSYEVQGMQQLNEFSTPSFIIE